MIWIGCKARSRNAEIIPTAKALARPSGQAVAHTGTDNRWSVIRRAGVVCLYIAQEQSWIIAGARPQERRTVLGVHQSQVYAAWEARTAPQAALLLPTASFPFPLTMHDPCAHRNNRALSFYAQGYNEPWDRFSPGGPPVIDRRNTLPARQYLQRALIKLRSRAWRAILACLTAPVDRGRP